MPPPPPKTKFDPELDELLGVKRDSKDYDLPESQMGFKNPEVEGEFGHVSPDLQEIAGRVGNRVPLTITSGARSPTVNDAAGGVSNSYHLKGEALDLRKTVPRNQLKDFEDAGYQIIDEPDHWHIQPTKNKPMKFEPDTELDNVLGIKRAQVQPPQPKTLDKQFQPDSELDSMLGIKRDQPQFETRPVSPPQEDGLFKSIYKNYIAPGPNDSRNAPPTWDAQAGVSRAPEESKLFQKQKDDQAKEDKAQQLTQYYYNGMGHSGNTPQTEIEEKDFAESENRARAESGFPPKGTLDKVEDAIGNFFPKDRFGKPISMLPEEISSPVSKAVTQYNPYVSAITDLAEWARGTPAEQVLKGQGPIQQGTQEFAKNTLEGFTTPKNVLLAAGLTTPAASAILAGMTPGMAQETVQSGQQAYKSLKAGDTKQATQDILNTLLSAGMTVGGIAGVGEGVHGEPLREDVNNNSLQRIEPKGDVAEHPPIDQGRIQNETGRGDSLQQGGEIQKAQEPVGLADQPQYKPLKPAEESWNPEKELAETPQAQPLKPAEAWQLTEKEFGELPDTKPEYKPLKQPEFGKDYTDVAKKEEGPILMSQAVPAAHWFGKLADNIFDSAKQKAEFVKNMGSAFYDWTKNDITSSEASKGYLRQGMAVGDRLKQQSERANMATQKYISSFPEDQRSGMIYRMSQGRVSPEELVKLGLKGEHVANVSSIMSLVRDGFNADYEQDLRTGLNLKYQKDYMPGLFQNPKGFEDFVQQNKSLFKTGYTKDKFWKDLEAAVTVGGLKLKTDNIIELYNMRHAATIQNMVMSDVVGQLKGMDSLYYGNAKDAPEGWKKLNYTGGVFEKDQNAFKSYFTPPDVAKTMNTWLSPGLIGDPSWIGKTLDLTNKIKNFSLSTMLSFSLFHPMATSYSASVMMQTNGLKKMMRGDFVGGAKDWVKGVSGIGTVGQNLIPKKAGGMVADVLDAYKNIQEEKYTPQQKKLIGLMDDGGFAPYMSGAWKESARAQWSKAVQEWTDAHPVKAVFKGIPAIANALSWPIMEQWIPRQKTGSYLRRALDWEEAHPDIQGPERTKALNDISRDVDNMFGQVRYKNKIENKKVQDLAISGSFSYGWVRGTVDFMAGALTDLTKTITQGGKKPLTPRSLDFINYVAYTSAIGSLMTYALTGHGPKSFKDMQFPQDGGTTKDGNPSRLKQPTMMGLPFELVQHWKKEGLMGAFNFVLNHTNPLFGTVGAIAKNEDYYKNEIRDPNAPLLNQTGQLGKYLLKNQLPISKHMQYFLQGKKEDSPAALNYMGFNRAPAYITQTPIQSDIYNLYQKRFGGSVNSKFQQEEKSLKKDLRDAYRTGDQQAIKTLSQKAVEDGFVQQGEDKNGHSYLDKFLDSQEKISKSTQGFDMYAFSRLPEDDQAALLAKMEKDKNYDDFNKYRTAASKKGANFYLLQQQKQQYKPLVKGELQ